MKFPHIPKIYSKLTEIKILILDKFSPYSSLAALYTNSNLWLSYLAKNKIKKGGKIIPGWSTVKNVFYEIHLPENSANIFIFTFLLVFLPQFIVYLWFISPLAPQQDKLGWPASYNVDILEAMWQVTAGLIGITFVIVIFIIDFTNRDKYERRALPVLFTETKFSFSASLGIFIILSMGIFLLSTDFNIRTDYFFFLLYFQWLLFFLNLINILLLFIRTIEILPQRKFTEKLKKYNHRIAAKLIEEELIFRFGSTISTQYFKESGIEFPFFEPDPNFNKRNVCLKNLPRHVQKISDINLGLVAIAYKHAKMIYPDITVNDFTFYAKLGHRIAKEKSGIAQIHYKLDHPYITNYLYRSVKYSDFSTQSRSNFSEILVLNRDMLSKAIINQEISTIENILNHYSDLIEAFLQITDALGIHFTQQSAPYEINLFFDWKLISTILDQYISLIPSFIISTDFNIVKETIYFPISLMRLAILYNDHLIFQQFINVYPAIYEKCIDIDDAAHREKVIDYFTRLLIEFRTYDLSARVDKTDMNIDKLADLRDYFQDLLLTWNKILKKTIDDRSITNFSKFSREVKDLTIQFKSNIHDTDLLLDQFKLDQNNDQNDELRLRKEFEYKKAVLESRNGLIRIRQRIFLGLGGWLVHLLETNKITPECYLGLIYMVNQMFPNIIQFYQDFSIDLGEEIEEHLFNWISWELSEKSESDGTGRFQLLDYKNWIIKYFLIHSIELAPHKEAPLPLIVPSIKSREIYNFIDQFGETLINSTVWQDTFRHAKIRDVEVKYTSVRSMFLEAKNQQQFLEEEEIIDAPLDLGLIKAFKDRVIKGWSETASIRNLVYRFGKHKKVLYSKEDRSIKPFGLRKHMIPKNIFLKQSLLDYSGEGEHYGHNLAIFEDKFLGAQMVEEKPTQVNSEQLIYMLEYHCEKMKGLGLYPFIFINGERISRILISSDKFIPAWRMKSIPFNEIQIHGKFNDCFVIQNHGILPESISLVDLKQFGTLSDYILIGKEASPLEINISIFSYEQAEKISTSTRQMIKHDSEKELVRDASTREVLQNVLIHVVEYCRFEQIDYKAVRTVQLIPEIEES